MKTWVVTETQYYNLASILNELEAKGHVVFWLHNPAGNSMVQIVSYTMA